MKVTLVVSSNKFTGAAAVAESWWQALRRVGVDARFLYVGGANLERRLIGDPTASPDLVKERRPTHVAANLDLIRRAARSSDAVMTFLPHDHLLAVVAGIHRRTCLIRAFRNPRHLYRDPFHLFLARRSSGAVAPFSDLLPATRGIVKNRPVTAVPAAVEDRFAPLPGRPQPDGGEGVSRAPVLGVVGKLAAGRGFELALDAAALTSCRSRLTVVGHGEHQPLLEERAAALGIVDRITWTGKRESDLPDLFHTMDAVLFPAPGSDWGHRVISEAQACGRPVIAVDHPGVGDLVRDGETGIVVGKHAAAVAAAMDDIVARPSRGASLAEAASRTVEERRFAHVGRVLANFIEGCLTSEGSHSS